MKLTVALGERSYFISIAKNSLHSLPDLIEKTTPGEELFVITDENVYSLYGELLAELLSRWNPPIFMVPAGETSKSAQVVQDLYTRLIENDASRKSVIIAFGGGVVGDLAGFVAATYMRGIPLVQIPTTILSQVDSSVGGKVGINHPLGKNLIGAFYQPRFVLIDPVVLKTLPRREVYAGLAEVVKYAFIRDENLFRQLQKSLTEIAALEDFSLVEQVLATCCRIKADIVGQDEKEAGVRAILNFGHTLGHALEAATDYGTFLHGEAVSHGMRGAIYLSHCTGRISHEDMDLSLQLIDELNPPAIPDSVEIDRILEAMKRDKKRTKHGQVWILPNAIGHVSMVNNIDHAALRETIDYIKHY